MSGISKTKYSSQYIDNMSFDDALKIKVVELIGADGVLKNPATEDKQDILSAYKITDIDDTGYYGYLKADGSWYIMQEISGAYRYIKGDSDYSTAWTGRAGLSYDYFNQVF
jgi:hypothetical protein